MTYIVLLITTLLEETCKIFRNSDAWIFLTILLGYFEKSGWGNYNPYIRMVIEFDDFTLIKLKVLGDATLSLNTKLFFSRNTYLKCQFYTCHIIGHILKTSTVAYALVL